MKILTEEEFEIFKEQMIDELIVLNYFKADIENGKQYISLTQKGLNYLETLIEKISKLILKEKPAWINLLTIEQLFIIQTELLKQIYSRPEMALLHLATEYKLDQIEIVAKDIMKLIEPDLIELMPKNLTIH